MGGARFASMVARQQLARRRKGADNIDNPTYARTLEWWSSREGRPYWQGPLCPAKPLVQDTLWRDEWGEDRCGAGGGRARRSWRLWAKRTCSSSRLRWERLRRGNKLPPPSLRTLKVSKAALARVAASATDQLDALADYPCRVSARVSVGFDALPAVDEICGATPLLPTLASIVGAYLVAGQRIPRVHVIWSQTTGSLALLDSAGLESLKSTSTLRNVRRLRRVRDRVVALTSWQDVAVALPRPHDQFDMVLRGTVRGSHLYAPLRHTNHACRPTHIHHGHLGNA
jgi:hypothetical protein